MRLKACVVSLLALGALAALHGAAAAPADSAEQAVRAAERQWEKAQLTNNLELLAPLLADRVVITTEDGTVLAGKDAVLADAKGTTWSSASETDLQVTVFGHAAVATGTFAGSGHDASGKTITTRVRFTDTWIQAPGGHWLCVAGHDSPLKN